jgi:hypothetical protein
VREEEMREKKHISSTVVVSAGARSHGIHTKEEALSKYITLLKVSICFDMPSD